MSDAVFGGLLLLAGALPSALLPTLSGTLKIEASS
jgi:hypothetical protein